MSRSAALWLLINGSVSIIISELATVYRANVNNYNNTDFNKRVIIVTEKGQ